MSEYCQKYAEELDEMNKEFIIFLTYLTEFVLFLPKTCFDEVILVDTNRGIKVPDLEFGEFLQFIGN